MRVVREMKGARVPSMEWVQPRIGQNKSEFMVMRWCRGLECGWFRIHKPLGDHREQGGWGGVGGRSDHGGEFLFSGVGADRIE